MTTTTTLIIDPEEFRRRIERETTRLFSERRMDADEMRDMAQRLSALVDFILPDSPPGDYGDYS